MPAMPDEAWSGFSLNYLQRLPVIASSIGDLQDEHGPRVMSPVFRCSERRRHRQRSHPGAGWRLFKIIAEQPADAGRRLPPDRLVNWPAIVTMGAMLA